MKGFNKALNKHCTKSTFYAIKEPRGITLIALIITIVVLLILASVTIANITGGDSTMEKAQQAKDKTMLSQKLEEVQNAIAISESTALNEGVSMSKLQTNLANISGVTLSTTVFPANVEIMGDPYMIFSDGELHKGSGGAERVPIPDGFVASQATGENDISKGLVIYEKSDINADDEAEKVTDDNVATARTTRNQFVWVPVDGNSLKFEQVIDTTKQSWYTNDPNDATLILKWEDNIGKSNLKSVVKYGGFYVGRYEAGWDSKQSDLNYEKDKHTIKNPVCKKSYAAWNYIYQTEAKTVCTNMYADNDSVKSQLIDSYAWDTTVQWMIGTDERVKNNPRNSVSYGNYYNSNYTFPNSILYADHTNSSGGLTVTGTYTRGTGANLYNRYVEIGTGEYEVAKVNNIYDMAGNMWEWTTEVGDHDPEKVTSGTYAVLRGGAFNNTGSYRPIVYRSGNASVTTVGQYYIGFRPVLYLK